MHSPVCACVYVSTLSVMLWTRWGWCGRLLGLDLFPGVPDLALPLHPASSSLGTSWNSCWSTLKVMLGSRRPPLLNQALSYLSTDWMLTEPCSGPGP